MKIDVTVQDANNILCEVTPPQPQIIVIDRGVEGNGIVSIVPVTISTFQYLRITYTNGTVQDVGPLTSTAYTATAPITIVGNTISLATVPIASGGTDATTAAGAIQNLLPSYTGNANKRLGLNSLATALEWVADGGGTVTSIDASGGTTGLSFTGGPITSSGTLTLTGTLAIANGGTGQTTANAAFNALAPSQTGNSGKYLTTDGSNTSWATNPLGTVTSVSGTGTVNGLTLTGTVTTSGSLTLGGTLSGIANSALTNSSITIGGTTISLGGSSNALANDITIYGVTVGRGAGSISTNTALGNGALSANTTGTGNTGIGLNSLGSVTTGIQNTAVGRSALYFNTGSDNSALGYLALYANTTGASNTAIGRDALNSNTTASYNTAVGYQAAYSNTTGSNVNAFGQTAAYSNTTGEITAIGSSSLYSNTTGTLNTAVGTASLYANTTGGNNVAVGRDALRLNTTASYNTAVGFQALYTYAGTEINDAFGSKALFSTTTGTRNTAVGFQAGYSNTTGYQNTAIGRDSLYYNTTSFNNTVVGHLAGFGITTGSYNTAVGKSALGDGGTKTGIFNSCFGFETGNNLTTGSFNVFVGSDAGAQVTTGSGNTFVGGNQVGAASGYAMTTGSGNTILGGFNGNSNGIDIRALNNYIVLSDGDGYPAFWGQSGSSGYMKLQAGRLEFPATQNASSNANTLDDYEEGTWTPVIFGSGTLGTESGSRLGTYVKIGRFVFLHAQYNAYTLSGAAGNITLSGLPFSVTNISGMSVYLEGLDPVYSNTPDNNITLTLQGLNSTQVAFRPSVSNGWDSYMTASTTWTGGGGGTYGSIAFWGITQS